MTIRKSLISLTVAGALALAGTAAFAQYPGMGGGYPGGMGGGGYPGGMGGGYPGGMGGAAGAPGTAAGSETVTTTTTSAAPVGTIPKAGGDPLTITAAGSLLLSAGYAVRRRFRGQ